MTRETAIHRANVQSQQYDLALADPIDRGPSRLREMSQTDETDPSLLGSHESTAHRILWLVVALAVTFCFYYMVRSYWAPAHPGVDQNGYQVGGRVLAETLTTGFKPPNEFSYVGWMYLRTPEGWYYPKYPLGVPTLDAICLWLGGSLHGVDWVYLVSPVCATLAVLGMFLLVRTIAGSFSAVLGMILLGSSPVMMVLSNNSNSHAPALAFSLWGMLALVWWLQHGRWWRGAIAGLLIGCAYTIRYTEGLLLLPLLAASLFLLRYESRGEVKWRNWITWTVLAAAACASRFFFRPDSEWKTGFLWMWVAAWTAGGIILTLPWRDLRHWLGGEIARTLIVAAALAGALWLMPRKFFATDGSLLSGPSLAIAIALVCIGLSLVIYTARWRETRAWAVASAALVGWLIPVVAQTLFNKVALDSFTGYDSTNESTAFTWKNFLDKWQYMVEQMHSQALFFIVPLGVLGMLLMYRKNWRIALLVTLWFWPGILIYSSYYWGLQSPVIGYLRFFLTLFPPLILGAAWLFDYGARVTDGVSIGRFRGRIAGPIAAGIVVAIAAGMNIYENYGAMERDFAINTNLADVGSRLRTRLPDEKDPARQPLLFGQARQLLNYIQFAGRFECYDPDAFTSAYWMRRRANSDPDAPNPLQPARLEHLAKVYEGKNDQALIKEAQKVINTAINANRRVFVALPSSDLPRFKGRFIGKEFDVVSVERWKEPVAMSDAGKKSLAGLGPAAGLWAGSGVPRYYEILEIVRKKS